MTTIDLDPQVGKKLSDFKSRRNLLIFVRGISAGILAFVLLFSLVAWIDWYWLLTDQFRWGLTIGSYILVAMSIWAASWKGFASTPDDKQAAQWIETTEPELRENLLSAVELATDDQTRIHDSADFRSLLQGQVAQRMGRIEIKRLLPLRLIAAWIVLALFLMASALTVLTVGDQRFRQLATRAILPGANIARISRTQVEVVSPSPASQTIAENETVAVLVRVSGGNVSGVTLETRSSEEGIQEFDMPPRSDEQYAANLQLDTAWLDYRILAGDAVTQWFRIETRPRPRVLEFNKEFTYPKYSRLSVTRSLDTEGDLIALEGTEVKLTMTVNQSVSKARLEIEFADGKPVEKMPLRINADQIEGRLKIDRPATYRVHLVSEETGFENTFSPRYEIRPKPDLIPKSSFLNQTELTLLLPANDIIELEGMAEDDLPLEQFEQQFSVNGEDWQTRELEHSQGKAAPGEFRREAAWAWDLESLNLSAGDEVLTRLVAIDLKGNQGKSIPLKIVIADLEFDPERHQNLLRHLSFFKEIESYSSQIGQLRNSAFELIDTLLNEPTGISQTSSEIGDLRDILLKQSEHTSGLLARSAELIQQSPPGFGSQEREWTALVLERILNDHLRQSSYRLESILLDQPENTRRTELEELKNKLKRVADDARSVRHHAQNFLAYDFLAGVSADLHSIRKQQQSVVEARIENWDRLKRQQAVVNGKLIEVQRLLTSFAEQVPGHLRGQVQSLDNWIDEQLRIIREASERKEQLGQLRSVLSNLSNQLEYKQRFDNIDGGLPQRIVGAWRDFSNRSGNLFTSIYDAGVTKREWLQLQKSEAPDAKQKTKSATLKWEQISLPGLSRISTRREISQLRSDNDGEFAADRSLTSRATQFLANQKPTSSGDSVDGQAHEHLLEVAVAYRKLVAGHKVAEVTNSIARLLDSERWNKSDFVSATDHPRLWEIFSVQLELAVIELRNARGSQELVNRLDRLRWSPESQSANRKITQRRWNRNKIEKAVKELETLQQSVGEIRQALQPELENARAVIRKFAPTVAEMARQMAEQVRQLETRTLETADAAESSQKPQVLDPLRQMQTQINERLDDLNEALVEDANHQDLLQTEQAERMRDADNAIQMLQKPSEMMNKALNQARESEQGIEQSKKLTQTAEKQEKTASVLDLIADHFDKLEQNATVDESRAELREIEQQLESNSPLTQGYEQANELAELTRKTPDELLQELEAELQRNNEMQQALSDIASNTLEQARNELELAADKEAQLQQANEKSDSSVNQRKMKLVQDLSQLGNLAAQLAREELQQANRTAEQGQAKKAVNEIAQSQKQLGEIARLATAANANQTIGDLKQRAFKIGKSLEEVRKLLDVAKQDTTIIQARQIHADENARRSMQEAWERHRTKYRAHQKKLAQDNIRRLESKKRQAENAERAAQRKLQQTEKRLQKARQMLTRAPDNKGRQNAVRNEENRKKTDQNKLAITKAKTGLETSSVEQAKQDQKDLDKLQDKKLDKANPSAQLANQFTIESESIVKKLQARLQQISGQAQLNDRFQPALDQLEQSAKQQQRIRDRVDETARELERAARHEKRLANDSASKEIETIAKQITQTSEQELEQAQQSLKSAANSTPQPKQVASNDQDRTMGDKPAGKKTNPSSPKAGDSKQKSKPTGKSGEQPSESSNQSKPASKGKQSNPATSGIAASQEKKKSSASANPMVNGATKAQQDLAKAEKALRDRADELKQKTEALKKEAANSVSKDERANGNPDPSQPSPSSPTEDSGRDSAQSNQSSTPSQQSPGKASNNRSALAAAKQMEGRRLAEVLDALDRQLNSPSGDSNESNAQSDDADTASRKGTASPNALMQAVEAQQNAMANARSQAQMNSRQSQTLPSTKPPSQPSDSLTSPALFGQQGEFRLRQVDRDGKEWGQLRGKSAEQTQTGRRSVVSKEYRKKVDAYFRVLAEQAKERN